MKWYAIWDDIFFAVSNVILSFLKKMENEILLSVSFLPTRYHKL